ncbi:SDR family NAD(P)-dependent oxidoreductase [Parapedobacter indicus]|nr:SDR family oxidoreductase [Parapedobacter indicus]
MMNVRNSFELTDRLCVVTGGAGLYGKPIALALAEAGACVVIASRNAEQCQAAATELVANGYQAVGMQLDLGEETSIARFIKEVIERFGRLDVLVNNAVSREGFKTLDQMEKSEWEASQRINSTGLMLITKYAVQHMVANRMGVIINIGSIQGVVGPNFPVYGDTGMTSPVNYTYDKSAMVGFTKWLANYYGRYGIRANCISPGGYGPGVEEQYGDNEFVANYKRLTPLGRFANEDDIKGPIVFLASDASAYVTGHNLLVDGGWTSW